jgi:hypothetical protein
MVENGKASIKNIFLLLFLIIVVPMIGLALIGPYYKDYVDRSSNSDAINAAKYTKIGQGLQSCGGAINEVKWTAFESSSISNKNVRVVEANVTTETKSIRTQWYYNSKTSLIESTYWEVDGKPENILAFGLALSFCRQ